MHRALITAAAAFALFQANAATAGPAKPFTPNTPSADYRLSCTVGPHGVSIIRNVGRLPIRRGPIYVTFRFGKPGVLTTKPRAVSVGFGLPAKGTITVAQPKGATSCTARLSTRGSSTRAR